MDAQTDILKRGLEHAALAVMDASALANLHLGPKRIGRGLAQRVSGRLRILETIVRRLILLMALGLQLAPTPPRPAPANPDLPEGVELAIFPRLSPRRLKLLPARQAFEGPGGFPDISGTSYGPVSPHKLMARIAALRRVIAAPEAHASRLARTLNRLQKNGEPKPMVGAATPAFRLSPELGALAAMLPAQISAGLETWESSG